MELVLSFPLFVGSGDWVQFTRLVLSHLARLHLYFFNAF